MNELIVKFYDRVDDEKLKYAVIVAVHDGKLVFCKHKKRSTYEIPGGHREYGETILETAKRELFEETGAVEYSIQQVCVYKVDDYGMLFFADIKNFENELTHEIEKIYLFDEIPEKLTYPHIQQDLIKKVKELNLY